MAVVLRVPVGTMPPQRRGATSTRWVDWLVGFRNRPQGILKQAVQVLNKVHKGLPHHNREYTAPIPASTNKQRGLTFANRPAMAALEVTATSVQAAERDRHGAP